jgi:hypothetical protein
VAGGGGLLGEPDGQGRPVEGGGAAEDGLGAGVVPARVEHQPLFGIEAVAAEGAGCFLHIDLAVVAFAEGEELEQLARQVFVGIGAVVGGAVEGQLQGRIEHHGGEQRCEAAAQVAADGGDLALQQKRIGQLVPVHREHAQPEVHLLRGGQIRPPGKLLQPAGLKPFGLAAAAGEPLFGGTVAAAIAGGLHAGGNAAVGKPKDVGNDAPGLGQPADRSGSARPTAAAACSA